nr:MAG TPA: hypothetical protein [Caudoviricetes sp.]
MPLFCYFLSLLGTLYPNALWLSATPAVVGSISVHAAFLLFFIIIRHIIS